MLAEYNKQINSIIMALVIIILLFVTLLFGIFYGKDLMRSQLLKENVTCEFVHNIPMLEEK